MQCPKFHVTSRYSIHTRLHVKICPAQDVSNLYPASSPCPSLSLLFAICSFLGSGSLLADPVHPPVATVPIPCAFPSLRSKRIPSTVFPGASDQAAPSTLVENCVHSARIRTGVRHNRATWSPAVCIHSRMELEKECEAQRDCLDVTCSYV